MTINEAFDVLALEQTKDEALIKQAYREKLVVTNPEDNPEGFKSLRQAYEMACAYANSTEDEEKPEEDDTPSGQFVKRASEIYADISRRRDADEWRRLFESEVFQSIEGEEQCREKLIIYIMDHFQFPCNVWNVLDEYLGFEEDYVNLKERFPQDFLNFAIRKCNGSDDIDFYLFEGDNYAEYDRYLQYYSRCWQAVDEKNYDLAQQNLEESGKLGIFHPVMEVIRAQILEGRGQTDEAVACLKAMYDRYPEDLTVTFNYADLCWRNGMKEEGARVYMEIKGRIDGHYMSNACLAEWYYDKGDYEEAKECIAIVMSLGVNSDEAYELSKKINNKLEIEYNRRYVEEGDLDAALELGWCYLQDGMYFKGIKLTKEIESRVKPEDYVVCVGLLAQLYIEEGMYQECIEKSDEWRQLRLECLKTATEEKDVKRYRGHVSHTYALKARAYNLKGYADKQYFEPGLKEIEAFFNLPDEFKSDAGECIRMEMQRAQLHYDMGEYEKCVDELSKIINDKQVYGAYPLLLRAYAGLWDANGVISASRQCINCFPQYEHAYEEVAKVFLDLKKYDDLKSVIEEAKQNNVNSVILEAYEYKINNEPDKTEFKVRMQQFNKEYRDPVIYGHKIEFYEKGYPVITNLLYDYPVDYMLIERGRFSMDSKDYENAKKDFMKVLERNPAEQFALNNLGCIYKYTGEYEEAIVCFMKAILYMDGEPNAYPYGNLAHTLEQMGEYEYAAQVNEALKKRFPENQRWTDEDLLVDYARSGQIDKALELQAAMPVDKKGWPSLKKCEALRDIYIDAALFDKAEEQLAQYADGVVGIYDASIKRSKAYKYQKMSAWSHFMKGEYLKALEDIRYLIDGLGDKCNTADNEVADICSSILFMMSCFTYGLRYAGISESASPVKFIETINLAKKLNYELYKSTKEGDDYIYREHSYQWAKFLVSYYTEGFEGNERQLENLEKSLKCKLCNNPCCEKVFYARAMMAVKHGDTGEALRIYKELVRLEPYEIGAIGSVIYLGGNDDVTEGTNTDNQLK